MRLELVDAPSVVRNRRLALSGKVSMAILPLVGALVLRASARGIGNVTLVASGVAVSIFAVFIAVVGLQGVSRARGVARPRLRFGATWTELSVFAHPESDVRPAVPTKLLERWKLVVLGLGVSPAELVWPRQFGGGPELGLTIADDVVVRLYVAGDRVGKVELERDDYRFSAPAAGRLDPFPTDESHLRRVD